MREHAILLEKAREVEFLEEENERVKRDNEFQEGQLESLISEMNRVWL